MSICGGITWKCASKGLVFFEDRSTIHHLYAPNANNKRHSRIVYQNVRGLDTRLSYFRQNLLSLECDDVAVTESFFTVVVNDSELLCTGWSKLRRDQWSEGRWCTSREAAWTFVAALSRFGDFNQWGLTGLIHNESSLAICVVIACFVCDLCCEGVSACGGEHESRLYLK